MLDISLSGAPKSVLTGVRGWETEGEQYALKYLAERVPQEGSIVEIGSEFGMSTSILAKYSQSLVYISAIDPFPEEIFSAHSHAMRELGVLNKIGYFRMKSESARVPYETMGGRPIDLLFIDGDHSTDGVITDIRNWIPLVKVGGIVAFHDTMAYTNMRPHEQHEWVQEAIAQWRGGALQYIGTTTTIDPHDFTEVVPVDSMRTFVRVAEAL